MRGLWVLLGLALTTAPAAVAAPAAYCTGQPVTDGSGAPYYPNGQQVVDGFGKEYYPNGARIVNDYGGEIRYSNGGRVHPCQRVVAMRERLAGGETVFYELDLTAGAIDLRRVRYEFPTGAAVITVGADLATGRLDRGSIGAVCPSTR